MSDKQRRSSLFRLKVWGDNACFTRLEMKVERVSYDVMTPSAARGIVEAIHWKPAIKWHISQIDVLKPIRWVSLRRNEVGIKMSPSSKQIFVEDQRQQRAGLFLRDVAYTIHAFFDLTEKAGTDDNVIKHQEMFLRRAQKGQCFHRPCLGCREFAADFDVIADKQVLPQRITETRELGWMLYDLDFSGKEPKPLFFRAYLENGSMKVPAWDSLEVRG
ncbi:MAG: type I-C CRISPR-associated protein Cas5 [Nitrospirae bacterium]|nr:type I-C CRISPR-associated protein Cas5 [Nitrospirota bacterium]